MFRNKTILITGGTGSFGNTVLKRFLKSEIKKIIIFSRDEKKQDDMRTFYNDPRIKFILGDVRNYFSILRALDDVDFVFHAAALKQVPSCEFYPIEAVQTNILGTENLLNACIEKSVKKCVVLSTDKAVYPINAMGISKAMAEKIMVAKSRFNNEDNSVFCATRYGNVMASRGSVIPLFVSKIKNKQPLTITDPMMTRFLMSLEDSVNLVVYAFENGNNGDIFIQKAPACTVKDLATALQELFEVKSKINIIGTRHGEKLFESLVSREEMAKSNDMGSYFRIPSDNRDLNYEKYITDGSTEASGVEDYTSHNTERLDVEGIKKVLLKLDYINKELGV